MTEIRNLSAELGQAMESQTSWLWTLKLTEAKHLHELVTPASWRFFDNLGISVDFLRLPTVDWEQNCAYKEAGEFLKNMKVTWSAERSVKLCADFLGLAKTEGLFQNYLQVVEEERKRTPNVRKARKRRKNWIMNYPTLLWFYFRNKYNYKCFSVYLFVSTIFR